MEEVTAAAEIERSNERRNEPRSSALTDQIDFRARRERHRRWRPDERLRIVEETLRPDTVIAEVARRHGIGTGLLYTWRKEMLSTAVAGLVPVQVRSSEPGDMPKPISKPASGDPTTRLMRPPGRIEVEFPNGVRVRIDGGADEAAVRGVLAVLSAG